MISKVLEITFVLIMTYLVIANAAHFSMAIQALGAVYGNSVKVLQGR